MKSLLIFLAIFAVSASAQTQCAGGVEFAPHTDCTLFYNCQNGIPLVQECPTGLYFNPTISACDYPRNVPECVGGTRPPIGPVPSTTPSPTSEVPTTTVPTTTQPTSAVPTTTRPTSANPTTTLPTTTRATTLPETPATESTGSTGAPGPGVCPPTGIVKIPHEFRCDAYYLCVNGQRQEESTCAAGLYFDPSIQECNLAENVNCVPATTTAPVSSTRPSMPECPETGVVQLPYPGNCTLYIMCIDSVPILYRCPDGQLFDVIDSKCKSESMAVCYEGKMVKSLEDQIIDEVVEELEQEMTYWAYMKNIIGSFRINSRVSQ